MSQERIILSFMGKSNLQETTYKLDGHRKKTRFFAEALSGFYPGYQLKVIMTEEAREMHGEALSKACSYEDVGIPSGKNESELWEMFAVIAEHIPENSELIVDVTHGFRSQPILVLAACVYLQVAKGVTVKQIIYGAHDAKDKDGIAPVFDLTSFLNLIDWSASARQFLRYGNAAPMRDLLKSIHTQTYKGQKEYRARGLTAIGERLTSFGDALAMARPQEVLEQSSEIPKALERASSDLIHLVETQPFGLLLEKVNDRIKPFTQAQNDLFTAEGFNAQAEMIRLYIETEQYALALTLAREALVSKICVMNDFDVTSKREHAEDYLYQIKERFRSGANIKRDERLIAELWEKISNLRNDISHAGMRNNPIPAQTAIKNIKSECERVARWIAL